MGLSKLAQRANTRLLQGKFRRIEEGLDDMILKVRNTPKSAALVFGEEQYAGQHKEICDAAYQLELALRYAQDKATVLDGMLTPPPLKKSPLYYLLEKVILPSKERIEAAGLLLEPRNHLLDMLVKDGTDEVSAEALVDRLMGQ